METAAALPSVFETLSTTLSSLPANLAQTNLSQLSDLLHSFAADLAPLVPSLSAAQQEALLTNGTFLAQQLAQLSAVTAQIPPGDVDGASPEDLVAIIEIGSTRYSILTLWQPEVWAIVLSFGIAAVLKLAVTVMVTGKVLKRAGLVAQKQGRSEDREANRAHVLKPAKAMLGHALNLVASTVALVLQLIAWRLFVLPSAPVRMADIRLLSVAMKTLLVGYAADLLFGDLRPEIFLHHFFTFALLFVGQLAAFQTKSPKFFRLAQYLILQATTEQTTYASMVAYHCYNYLRVQDYRPRLQRRLLVATHKLLRFTRYITFPQKLLPCAFAVYWLARMWNEIDDKAWGRAWIVWCTMVLSLLMILQIRFCDDTWPLAAHIGYKLHGGALPPRQGPVMCALARLFCCRRRERPVRNSVRPAPPTDSYRSSLKVDSKEDLAAAEEGRSRKSTSAGDQAGASIAELVELRKMADQGSTLSSRCSSRRSLDTAWSTPFRPLSLPHLEDRDVDTASTHLSDLPFLERPGSAPPTSATWIVVEQGDKKDPQVGEAQ
ncbi:hypothetical protein JCM9279_004635 [Rhodotorula babjevae]